MALSDGTVRFVTDHQYGSELDGDHAAGATSLTVIWTNDFNADGGQLYFEDADGNVGEIVSYTIPTEDPSDPNNDTPSETDIDLATPLANSYLSGDKVWVYPKKVERWCYFMEPNGSEPLPARVRHNLRPLLPLGGRTDDTAEQVLIEEEGTDQVVIDVLAEEPKFRGLELHMPNPDLESITWIRESDGALAAELFVGMGSGDDPIGQLNIYNQADRSRKATFEFGTTSSSGIYVAINDGAGISRTVKVLGMDGTSDFGDEWKDWTPTFTGWSVTPAGGIYRYKQIGKLVHVAIRQPNTGTSNATTLSISAPVAAATITNMRWGADAAGIDNGVNLATPSRASIDSGASTINFAKDYSTNTGGWTAAGNKGIRTCHLVYESA